MVLAARSRVGVAIALLGPLGMFTFGPTHAYAATIAPTVTLTGQLIQLADQTGPAVPSGRQTNSSCRWQHPSSRTSSPAPPSP